MVNSVLLTMLPPKSGTLQVAISKDTTKDEFDAIVSILREKFFNEMVHDEHSCGIVILEATELDKAKPDNLTLAIREFKELVGFKDAAQVFWKEYQNPIVINLIKAVRNSEYTVAMPKLKSAGMEWLYYMVQNITIK